MLEYEPMSLDRDLYRLPDTSAKDGGHIGECWVGKLQGSKATVWGEPLVEGDMEIQYTDPNEGLFVVLFINAEMLMLKMSSVFTLVYDRATGDLDGLLVNIGRMLIDCSDSGKSLSAAGLASAQSLVAEGGDYMASIDVTEGNVAFYNTINSVAVEEVGVIGLELDEEEGSPVALGASGLTPFQDIDFHVSIDKDELQVTLASETGDEVYFRVGKAVDLESFFETSRPGVNVTRRLISQALLTSEN